MNSIHRHKGNQPKLHTADTRQYTSPGGEQPLFHNASGKKTPSLKPIISE
jgi:hypothetical protein